ncbi:hypothetical protein CAI21_17255 [Alkalilimnicola ehrlichii]|nr:hypothetical protein CAI21_17255 [Alkalilimnicola ehrlichii]
MTVSSSGGPLYDARGRLIGAMGINTDITAYKQTLGELDRERERAQVTLESIADGVVTTDMRGCVTYLNPAAEALCGWQRMEAAGRPVDEVVPLRDEVSQQRLENPVHQLRRGGGGGTQPLEVVLLQPSAEARSVELRATALRSAAGRLIGSVLVLHDVTTTRALAKQLSYQAVHDPLTGLPNRALLHDRILQAVTTAERHGHRLALLYLDLDRFKHINDTLGHPVGDKLLAQVARRLLGCVRPTDTVSRQGGDEFAILLTEEESLEAVANLAAQIVQRIAAPYRVVAHELHISTSMGISVFPEDGRDPEELVRHADIAMYHAKQAGRDNFQFFIPEMNQRAMERLHLEHDLRRALERQELMLQFQPQVSLKSRLVVGAEALLRWRHGAQGMIPPDRFIPVAEDSGLILEIGDWVLAEACRQTQAWRLAGLPELRIAVNVSAAQFRRPTIIRSIRKALEASGLPPRLLELELTESMVMTEAAALTRLNELRALGIRLSIDDFGTGYSSLSYLKQLPVDDLKIDQAFVRDISSDPNDAAIVQAIIRMGHTLHLSIVAEGVESQEALEFLAENDCDSVQGYYLSRPLEGADFERFVVTRGR